MVQGCDSLERDFWRHYVRRVSVYLDFDLNRRNMVEENGSGAASNFIWAFALIVIVAIVMGALYYGGFLSGKQKKEIDVNVSVPSR